MPSPMEPYKLVYMSYSAMLVDYHDAMLLTAAGDVGYCKEKGKDVA